MSKCSIAMARQSIEHLIALHEKEGSLSTICEQARHGASILGWLDRRQDLVRAVAALEKEQPDIAEIFRTFPGHKDSGVALK